MLRWRRPQWPEELIIAGRPVPVVATRRPTARGVRLRASAIKGRIVRNRCQAECLGMQEERKEREAWKVRRVGRKREELAGSRHVINHMTAIYAGV